MKKQQKLHFSSNVIGLSIIYVFYIPLSISNKLKRTLLHQSQHRHRISCLGPIFNHLMSDRLSVEQNGGLFERIDLRLIHPNGPMTQ